MSRLRKTLEALRRDGRKGLVAYLVAGDPSSRDTVALMHAAVAGGANVIELGVPFTDPVADGPVIQAACERALRAGTRLRDVFAVVREFRETDTATPVVLMGYLNPLEALGYEQYAHETAAAGADAILAVDLPAEEADELGGLLAARELELVCLTSPTTSPERLRRICRSATGFVYHVSLKGVTGAGGADWREAAGRIATIRELTDVPVGLGFGIADAAGAAAAAEHADAVIVGSALVRQVAEHGAGAAPVIRDLLGGIRAALDEHKAA